MAVKQIFNCDVCDKEFEQRDDKGNPEIVGGMVGFYEKDVLNDEKVMEKRVLQYNLDLCPVCNKKIVDYYFEIGGK